jgi:hypothetical protein
MHACVQFVTILVFATAHTIHGGFSMRLLSILLLATGVCRLKTGI